MYIRVKTYPNSSQKAIQIIKTVRLGKKVSQKIVRHIGTAENDTELKAILALAESIKSAMETNGQIPLFAPEQIDKLSKPKAGGHPSVSQDSLPVNLKQVVEEDRVVSGIHDIYGKLFEELNITSVFKNPARQTATVRAFKDIVLARAAQPLSKRSSVEMLEHNFGISLNLDFVYAMMDKLDDDFIAKLNTLAYNKTKQLLPEPIDIIFFDCTTLYFESFTEDEFKKNGYSKDLKFNQPQVLVALMVTSQGLPIGYRAFPGNTYEGHTVLPALQILKQQYQVNNIVFVADSGMNNQDTVAQLTAMQNQGISFVLGCRLKNLPKKLQTEVLDKSKYQVISDELRIGQFTHNGQTLLVSWSKKRAEKDRHDREKAVERLNKKLEKQKNLKAHLSNYGQKKYLNIDGEVKIKLDEEKVASAAAWDGLHGVITNSDVQKPGSSQTVLERYGQLWEVENAFRITKHDLRIRPIFHWKPKRVKAHLAICFTAYVLVKHLEYRVKLQYQTLSPEQIRRNLLLVQKSILYDTEKKLRYVLPSSISKEAQRIYQLMKLTYSRTPYKL